MTKTFVISDTHFHHTNILKFYPKQRPFSSVEEMNEKMILEWNRTVDPSDTVYHLGDFSFGTEQEAKTLLDRLNGKIHLILGNHDKSSMRLSKFESISNYKEIKVDNTKIIMFHYPIEEWNGMYKDNIHFYGHLHSIYNHSERRPVKKMKNRYDVGVENIGLKPINIFEAMKLARGE